MADRVGTLSDVLSSPSPSTSERGRQAQFAAMRRQLLTAGADPATAKKKAREAEFALMRHELAHGRERHRSSP